MARITPRFVSFGPSGNRDRRHVPQVSATMGEALIGSKAPESNVSFSLTVDGKEGDPQVYVTLNQKEAERIYRFSEDMAHNRPMDYELVTRRYCLTGGHLVSVKGWTDNGQWFTCEDIPLTCEGYDLGESVKACILTMARHSLSSMSITAPDGQSLTIHWTI